MKFSWTSLKISIAGAKLSHLVQKDKIWDHGSMAEQARIIFCLVQKAKATDDIESLRKHCSMSCFEKLVVMMKASDRHKNVFMVNPMIKEVAVLEVCPGKNSRPDMFTALIKGVSKYAPEDGEQKFSGVWSFVRQGEWWLLDGIKS